MAQVLLLASLGSPVPDRCASAQVMHSFEAGRASVGEYTHVLQVGYRGSPHPPSSVGVEYAVAIAPQFLVAGALLAIQDLDLRFGVGAGDDLVLTTRAGGSVFLAAGQGVAGAVAGYNAGVGALVRIAPGAALRLDYTYRRFPDEYDHIRISSLTLGLVVLRGPPGAR